jgi:hypothetical protein
VQADPLVVHFHTFTHYFVRFSSIRVVVLAMVHDPEQTDALAVYVVLQVQGVLYLENVLDPLVSPLQPLEFRLQPVQPAL